MKVKVVIETMILVDLPTSAVPVMTIWGLSLKVNETSILSVLALTDRCLSALHHAVFGYILIKKIASLIPYI